MSRRNIVSLRRCSPGFFGWRVVAAAFTIAVFGWGVGFYGPAIFLNALHEGRGWPVSIISLAITCHFLLSAILVARLPALHRRFGLAAVTRAGAVAAALGAVGWALAVAPWQLFPAALLSGFGWACTSGAAINAIVAPWFNRRRPAAISMAFNGSSIGGAIFAPLWPLRAIWVRRSLCGDRFSHDCFALAGSRPLSAADTGRYGADPRWGCADDGCSQCGAGGCDSCSRPAGNRHRGWGDRRFATLSVAFALGLFAQIGLFTHLFSLLVPALGEAGAGTAISLVTLCAVLGRVLLGALMPAHADRRIAAAANFAAQIAGSIALLTAGGSSIPLLLLGCALFGLGVGNLVSLPPLIAQIEFDRSDVPRVVALVTAANQAVFAFAPAALGVLRDMTGASWTLIPAVGLVQMLGAGTVLAGRHQPVDATIEPRGSTQTDNPRPRNFPATSSN
jgi:MFS family permease